MDNEPKPTEQRVTRAGDYDLVRRMGMGGFGAVFEARHRESGLPYAVKRINLCPEDAERFRNEALYPARIASRSLHVLGVHSSFYETDENAFYLVTELIPHGDLRSFMKKQPQPLPLTQTLELAIGIAKGLAAIHAQGIIHRDLKPENVLMDRKDDQWVPKIADFGLARSTQSVLIGAAATSGYASPEQLDFLSGNPVGPESDLFSFGMLLHELLTGQKLAPRLGLEEYGRWLTQHRPLPLPSATRKELADWPALDSLVGGLLEYDRSKRIGSATEVVRTLSQILQDAQSPRIVREPSGPKEEPGTNENDERPSLSRRRVLSIMAAVFAATGSAMHLGIPSVRTGGFLVRPPMPETILTFPDASVLQAASWIVLPALFGFALGLATRLTVRQSALVSVLGVGVYNSAILIWTFLLIRVVPDGTPVRVREILGLVGVGMLGATFMALVITFWRRQLLGSVPLIAAAGVLGSCCFFLKGVEAVFVVFAGWQVLVGIAIIDRTLFRETKVIAEWRWRPVVAVAGAAVLLSAAGTWQRHRPPTTNSESVSKETMVANSKDQANYVWIPEGSFDIGCSADDSDCNFDETPTRFVTFSKGFWLAAREVSVQEWKRVIRVLPQPAEWRGLTYNPGWSGENMPVMNVTWDDARKYCNAVDGRLPTEAEWEYAARARTRGARYGKLQEIAVYADNSASELLDSARLEDESLAKALVANRNSMRDVGTRFANDWSLKDMLGNVAEWVEDDYAENAYSTVTYRQNDPPAHLTGIPHSPKVVRGGSWASRPRELRASARGLQGPMFPSVFIGFRCVWNKPEK